MKTRFTTTLLALGLAGVSAAQAQYSPTDLVLGFTGGTSGNDVMFDIGNASTLSTANLNNSFSASLLGGNGYSTLSGTSFGVIGYGIGANAGIYSTLAPGYTPNSVPNMSSYNVINGTVDSTGYMIDGSGSPANSIVISSGNPNSWNANVASSAPNTFYNSYQNPDVQIGSGVTVADLYFAKDNGSTPQLLGEISIDPNAETLSFTPAETPEPGTIALMTVSGALAFAFRRHLRRSA